MTDLKIGDMVITDAEGVGIIVNKLDFPGSWVLIGGKRELWSDAGLTKVEAEEKREEIKVGDWVNHRGRKYKVHKINEGFLICSLGNSYIVGLNDHLLFRDEVQKTTSPANESQCENIKPPELEIEDINPYKNTDKVHLYIPRDQVISESCCDEVTIKAKAVSMAPDDCWVEVKLAENTLNKNCITNPEEYYRRGFKNSSCEIKEGDEVWVRGVFKRNFLGDMVTIKFLRSHEECSPNCDSCKYEYTYVLKSEVKKAGDP